MKAFDFVKLEVMKAIKKWSIVYEIELTYEQIEQKASRVLRGYEFNELYLEDIKKTVEKNGVESVLMGVRLSSVTLGYDVVESE